MGDVLRMMGGPFDGAELDPDLFGGRRPAGIAVPIDGAFVRYEWDEDGPGGASYRFVGWDAKDESETG